jgi:VCBS repeat-containing protein
VVKVQDNGTGNLSSQAKISISLIDINETPFISKQSFLVLENSYNGTDIGTVYATDPDFNQTLIYSIHSGNLNEAFSINPTTGLLSINDSSEFNYETSPSFELLISIEDNGTDTLSNQAIITITVLDINEMPVIIKDQFTIVENSNIGTIVGSIEASDPDNQQIIIFSMLSGNMSDVFSLNPTSGLLTVANSTALDYETNPLFKLLVEVKDNGPLNLSCKDTIYINLIDKNENPFINNQTFWVPINNFENGALVGTVLAYDPDNAQALTYAILDGNSSNTFSINSNTGELYVEDIVSLGTDTNWVHFLTVEVRDNGIGTLTKQANISIKLTSSNDAPVIFDQAFNLPENTPVGTLIGKIVANDPNIGQTLRYSLISGNSIESFILDSISGQLLVSDSVAFDFEKTSSFLLVVSVQDNGQGSLKNQAIITINLIDVNDSIVNQDTNSYQIFNENTINVYPNPTSGLLNINCEELDSDSFTLQLINISGKIVHQKDYTGIKSMIINVDSLPKATYILIVRTKVETYSRKIIVK